MCVVEVLRFETPPGRRDEFLARDAEVWTPALAQHDGFLSKHVWASLDHPDRVTLVIRWESLDQWKSFSVERCQELDAQMGDLLCFCTCESYEERNP